MTTHDELERALTTVRALYRRAVVDGDRELEVRLRPVDRAILSEFPNTPADGPMISDDLRVIQDQARWLDERSHELDTRERLLNRRENALDRDEQPIYDMVRARVEADIQAERQAMRAVQRQRDAERDRQLAEHRAQLRAREALDAGPTEPQPMVGQLVT